MIKNTPLPPSARVAKSRRAAVAAGAERVEVILRDPVAIAALAQLRQQHGCAGSLAKLN